MDVLATNWTYSHDLESPPARFEAEFLESNTARWLQPGEVLSKDTDQRYANIFVTVNGFTEKLLEGVIREWGHREAPDGVEATIAGVDKKADLLDFYPSVPYVYRGMELLSASTAPIPTSAIRVAQLHSDSLNNAVKAAYFQTFKSVAKDVVEKTGYTVDFDCYDYMLGTDIIWEIDRTANDVLSQLVSPFNATERYKLDLILASNTVRFVERGRSTPNSASVEYDNFLSRQIRKSRPPQVNDVQVIGAPFRFPEANQGNNVVWGWPSPDGEPYKINYRVLHKEAGLGEQPIIVAETTGTRYFDGQGKETSHTASKNYSLVIYRRPADPNKGEVAHQEPRYRREDTTETMEYNGPHGEMTKRTKTVFVEDNTWVKLWAKPSATGNVTFVETTRQNNIAQFVSKEENEWVYDANGDPMYEISKHYQAEEPHWKNDVAKEEIATTEKVFVVSPKVGGTGGVFPGDEPTGLVLERETEQFWWWSKGQRINRQITRLYDSDRPAQPAQMTDLTTVATGKATAPKSTAFASENLQDGLTGVWIPGQVYTFIPAASIGAGQRLGQGQVKAGPDHAQLKFSFGVLGHPDDCEYFRGKIKSERTAWRYEVNLGSVPELNIREGNNLTVLSAPSRWQTSTFFIQFRSMRHQPDEMTMELRGVAWLAT